MATAQQATIMVMAMTTTMTDGATGYVNDGDGATIG